MKRSYFIPIMLILVLSLYSAQNLSASYGSATIPAQPNMSKDFAISNYEYEYNTSSYSITSFSETLEDDVFYTPDGFYDDTIVLASEGGGEATNNDWADSLHVDGYRWTIFSGLGLEYASFAGDYNIEGFDFAIYGLALGGGGGGGNISIMDASTSEWIALLDTTNTTEQWYNGTYFGPIYDYYPPRIYLVAEGYGGGAISIDYMEIRFYYLPLTSPNYHYGDSFTNVSDWFNGNGEGEPTTDGDVCSWEIAGDGNSKNMYSSTISLYVDSGDYVEIKMRTNHTTPDQVNGFLYAYTEDDKGGSLISIQSTRFYLSDDWSTIKFHVAANGTIESLMFYIRAQTGGAGATVYYDLLRIGPSDEMGFQHDCSNIIATDGDASISSDGDKITVTATGAVQYIDFDVDITTTQADVDTDYYPFIEWSITYLTDDGDGNCWLARMYDDGGYNNLPPTELAYSDSTGIFRANINVIDIEFDTLRFYIADASDSIIIDYVKVYGIANFTYDDGGGESSTDYAYTQGDALVIHTDTYTKLNHDPVLDVTIASYPYWNATIEGDDSGFRFRELQDTNTLYAQGITNGSLVGTTLEDFDLLLYNNTYITSINFYGYVPDWRVVDTQDITFVLPAWNIVGTVIIYFLTPIGDALNIWYILLGLIMLPCSTLFLVHGGREKLSMDKAFFFIVLFMLGWALIIGGIF